MEIVPAILETTPAGFKATLEKVVRFAKRIQVDFNDGSFEETVTVKPEEIAIFVLPYTDLVEFEAHLMVQNPMQYVPKLKEMGFRRVIVQFEIASDLRHVLEELEADDFLVGLAVAPETPITDVEPFADLVDTITVMDIEPGKQGQKFMPAELQKIRELKDGNFPGEIQADGAVSEENLHEIVEAGADTAVVGSAIVKAVDPESAFLNLTRLLQ